MTLIAELIVEGALDDDFELTDSGALDRLVADLDAEARKEEWEGELHVRPSTVENAGEFADDGSRVIKLPMEVPACG